MRRPPACHRRFALLAVMACGFAACEDRFESPLRTHLSGTFFSIGSAEQYRTPGIYEGYLDMHGIYVVSYRGTVVALRGTCPRDGKALYLDDDSQQFRCPHCAARFDSNGLPRAPAGATESMVRLRVSPVDDERPAGEVELQVNPRFEFRQEKNEWSSAFSMFYFDPP